LNEFLSSRPPRDVKTITHSFLPPPLEGECLPFDITSLAWGHLPTWSLPVRLCFFPLPCSGQALRPPPFLGRCPHYTLSPSRFVPSCTSVNSPPFKRSRVWFRHLAVILLFFPPMKQPSRFVPSSLDFFLCRSDHLVEQLFAPFSLFFI